MLRSTKLLSLLLAAASLVQALPREAQAQLSVEGAWTVDEWKRDGETMSAEPGIFIFTSTHYSFFFVNQPEARAVPADAGPNGLADVAKVTAYDEITANAGRYAIEGNKLTTQAYVAKNPGYMAGWPDNPQEYTVRRNGDTVTLTFASGNVATLIRREGQAPPG